MKFRELREQIERPRPPVIPADLTEMLPPRPPRPHFEDIETAINYIKGYCNKHQNCNERCRLYDTEDGACIFYDAGAGTPCDWEMPKREEDEDV